VFGLNIGRINGWWGLLAGIGVAAYFSVGWVVRADDSHRQTRSNTEQLQMLTDLEKAKVEKVEAEIATKLRLCQQRAVVDPEVCAAAELEFELWKAKKAQDQ
jgi:hypothetical protein